MQSVKEKPLARLELLGVELSEDEPCRILIDFTAAKLYNAVMVVDHSQQDKVF